MSHHSVAVLAVLAALTAPAAAAAESEPVVGVLDVRHGSVSDVAARTALMEALAHHRVRVVDEGVAFRATREDLGAARSAEIENARALAAEGRELFAAQDAVGAEKKLRAAADLIEQQPCAEQAPGELVSDYLSLAQIFFATDRASLVREIFHRIVQLAPDLTLDASRFSPQFIRLFDQLRTELLSGPLGKLHVDSSVSNAQVTLDGVPRGAVPVEIVNLPPGIHRLCVAHEGYAPAYQPIDVSSFRTESVHADLALSRLTSLDGVFENDPDRETAEYLHRVVRETGVDLLVVGRWSNEGTQLRTYSAAANAFGARIPLASAAPDDESAEALLRDAAAHGWVAPVASRRNVASGGGALDDTTPHGLRVGLAAGANYAPHRLNFPRGPETGLRIGTDYRINAHWVVSAESGLEMRSEGGIVLVDSHRQRLSPGERGAVGIDLAAPLDLSLRWYGGLSTLAPFASVGAGVRFDWLFWEDTMPESSISSGGGVGGDAWFGGGFERALGARSAVSVETRMGTARMGRRQIVLRTLNSPRQRIPVDSDFTGEAHVFISWRRVF